MESEKLIEEIRKFPVLYDQSHEKYRNVEYKERVWTTIAATLEVEDGVEECKKKWASMRDQLRRTIQKRKSKAGQAAAKIRHYKYEDLLTFLLPHLGEKEGPTNVPQRKTPVIRVKPEESPASQLMSNILAEKEALSRKATSSEQHPVDAFLCGLAPTLKSLNPILLNEAKGKMFSIVQELELKQLNESSQARYFMPNNSGSPSPSPLPPSNSATGNQVTNNYEYSY